MSHSTKIHDAGCPQTKMPISIRGRCNCTVAMDRIAGHLRRSLSTQPLLRKPVFLTRRDAVLILQRLGYETDPLPKETE